MKQIAKQYIDSNEVLNRLKKHFDVNSDTELSEKINVPRGTMSTWRRRNIFDYEIILQLADLHNLDLNDLILGKPRDKKNINVPVVTNKHADEYLKIKDNADLLNKLPTVNILDLPKNFAYRGFQFAECFMAGMQTDAIAIGKLIDSFGKVVNGLPYVVVCSDGTLLCGRISAYNIVQGSFRLQFDNIKNTNRGPWAELNVDSIIEFWEIQSVIVKNVFNFMDDDLRLVSDQKLLRELTEARAQKNVLEKEFNNYRFLVMSTYGDR